ncbi:MAG: aldehyde dehydrogenase [Alphaproteobacteria bacterium]|jgi:aldehyde dehydrogenase (NAD+)|nr:aldehyde dehydrogenase [Alphaproteobacteria bacterium]MDP6564231.1 aldehyde dehydrogenase [Alphaproteobacteria bacterium]MDP6814003.1 aldehyde dehydrogenase [Alphaproteobacteria bacterium]
MSELAKYQMYIGGEWVDPVGGEWFDSFNPYTGQPWARMPRGGEADVDRAVTAADDAFSGGDWPALSPSQRGALLRRLGDLIAENAQSLAEIEVRDNGKLIAEMAAQLSYVPQWYYYFGGLADKIEGAVIPIDKPETFNYTRHEPLGVVAAISPWNSPLLLATWKLAPALAAGNTVVLKPSEFTSASTLEFVKLFEQAGFPPGVVNIITGFGHEAGAALVSHPKVAKVAFTGGEMTGQKVYQAAAVGLKPVTLELGGKSPNIVFDDTAMENAVKGVISGIFAATGQTCIAGSRLLVQNSIHNEFVDRLVDFAATARMGDPQSMDTQVGPVTTLPQMEKILGYIDIAKDEGAECVLGGHRAQRPECGEGWFVEPTVFTGVRNDMRIAREEVFGPVLSVIPFDDEEDAIAIANDNPYGLAAGVWTQSIKRAIEVSNRLQAGTVWVNTYRAVSYLSPFGGYKRSGLGRESGKQAIMDYLQTKSVWISTSDEVPNPFILR